MKTEITVYSIGAEPVTSSVDWPDDPGYQRIKDFVTPLLNGGDLERVRVLHEGVYTDMFVDEDGIRKGLPINNAATPIYHANMLSRQADADTSDWPKVHGTAILFHRQVWF